MSHYCYNKNIILTTSNAYDWFYTNHLLNVKPDSLYLWPNFARHFVDDFGIHNIDDKPLLLNNNIFILHSASLSVLTDCHVLLNETRLMMELTLNKSKNIQFTSNRTIFNNLLYNLTSLHIDIGGIIAIPHSVHGAKWIEYYSIGIQLFIPSIKFWLELNKKCEIIAHRQSGNKPHKGFGAEYFLWFGEYIRYSSCGRYNPIEAQYQDKWIPFSDYFMDKYYFKYIIYFDSENDLIDKIDEYNKLSMDEKWNRKQKQINDFTLLAESFTPHLIHKIYSGYLKSEQNVI